jgi:transcriptional regulator of arginine metabolism
LKAVKRIIRQHRINSQEILLSYLQREGFTVTQATLSRDLKLLKVGKVSEGEEGYYYTLPSEDERRESERSYTQDLQRGYVSIDFSGNLALVRTLPGHADTVALALDNLNIAGVLGTLAGDDTVIMVLQENFDHQVILASLRERVPDLEE